MTDPDINPPALYLGATGKVFQVRKLCEIYNLRGFSSKPAGFLGGFLHVVQIFSTGYVSQVTDGIRVKKSTACYVFQVSPMGIRIENNGFPVGAASG